MIEPHCTTQDLAELLRVHPETIRRAAARGELRSLRIGGDRRYPESAVREWLNLLEERAGRRGAA